jgi:hypothetical protein
MSRDLGPCMKRQAVMGNFETRRTTADVVDERGESRGSSQKEQRLKRGDKTNELTWLSKNGCTSELAAPAARHASRSYEPTGSNEYTAPDPTKIRANPARLRNVHTILFNATKNVVHVVGEEPTRIQHCLDKTRDSAERHIFCMCMAVPLRGRFS